MNNLLPDFSTLEKNPRAEGEWQGGFVLQKVFFAAQNTTCHVPVNMKFAMANCRLPSVHLI